VLLFCLQVRANNLSFSREVVSFNLTGEVNRCATAQPLVFIVGDQACTTPGDQQLWLLDANAHHEAGADRYT
jgi:hypothetical protein